MKERTLIVKLGDKELEVFTGNMAIMRFQLAGGNLSDLKNTNNVGLLDATGQMKCVYACVLYLWSNLTVKNGRTVEGMINDLPDPHLAIEPAGLAISHVPWFMPEEDESEEGESQEEGTTDSSDNGPSPSSNSDGTQINSGASPQENGIT